MRSLRALTAALVLLAGGLVQVSLSGAGSAAADTLDPASGQYQPLTLARIVDSRSGLGTPSGAVGKIGNNTTWNIPVLGKGGVPSDGVLAVAVEITTVNTVNAGYLTAYPTGQGVPAASTLNQVPGVVVANLAIVPVGTGGQISLYDGAGVTDVLIDVQGYVTSATDTSAAGLYTPVVTSRIFDTRTGQGGVTGTVGANTTISEPVAGQGGVPTTGVSAYVINVGTVDATAVSYLTVWPHDQPRPASTSSLNTVVGHAVTKMLIVPASSDGRISIFNYGGAVNVLGDIVGYFTTPTGTTTGDTYVPLTATRIIDTRPASQIGNLTTLAANSTNTVPVLGAAGVPATGVDAVALNFITVNSTCSTSCPLEAYADSPFRPDPATTIMASQGVIQNNTAFIPVGSDGKIAIYNALHTTDLLIEVVGYFAKPTTPDAPSLVTSTKNPDGTVTVNWAPPLFNGGGSITGYTVTATGIAGTTGTKTVSTGSAQTSAVVTGTSTGSWSYSVTATNAIGAGLSATAVDATNAQSYSATPVIDFNTADNTGLDPTDPVAPLDAGTTVTVPVTGTGDVPVDWVTAVAVDVATSNATTSGSVTVWNPDQTRPSAPSAPIVPNMTRRVQLYAPVDTNGNIGLYVDTTADVSVTVIGYLADTSDDLHPPDVPLGLTASVPVSAPILTAGYTDADGDLGTLTFVLYANSSSNTAIASGTTGTLLSGEQGTWSIPAGDVAAGQNYYYTVTANDGQLLSPSAGTSTFSVTAAPTQQLPADSDPGVLSTAADAPDISGAGDPSIVGYSADSMATFASSSVAGTMGDPVSVDGFTGPYFDVTATSGKINVLTSSLTTSTGAATWQATGLARNETAAAVGTTTVTATLKSSTGSTLAVVNSTSPVTGARPGEPVPFTIAAPGVAANAVASVTWTATASGFDGTMRAGDLQDNDQLPAGSRIAASGYPWTDTGSGPYPFVDMGSVANNTGAALQNVRVVTAYLSNDGQVVWVTAPTTLIDTSGAVNTLAANYEADYVITLADSPLSETLEGLNQMSWEMNS